MALSIADEYTPTGRIGGKYGCRTSARKKRDLSHDPELHQRKRGASNPDEIYRSCLPVVVDATVENMLIRSEERIRVVRVDI